MEDHEMHETQYEQTNAGVLDPTPEHETVSLDGATIIDPDGAHDSEDDARNDRDIEDDGA